MLQNIRDRAQGWLAWVIVGLLIIPFALWGIQEYLGPSGKVVVAKVDQVEISRNQFEQAVDRQMRMFSESFGQDISALKDMVEKNVLNQMIEEEILWQQAGKQGLRIGNEWLAAQIQSIPSFQKDKQFSQAEYESLLSRQGLNPVAFEQDYRRSLTTDQWRKALLGSALWTATENQYYQAIDQQTRQISYVKLTSDSFKEKIEITDADLQAFYDNHKDNYLSEERVSLDYVTLATEQLKDALDISETGLNNYYEEQIKRFTTPARWQARHIFVMLEHDADATAETTAQTQANDLLAQIQNSDYDSVETTWLSDHSDAGGELDGGDWITEESALPEIFAAIKDLKAGDNTGIVRTKFGYHIVHVLAAEATKVQTLAEVRETLMPEYQKEEARKLFYERAEEFNNLAYENPDNLTMLAETLGLTVQSTELFNRAGNSEDDLLKNPKVLEAAFSAQVLQNQNSNVLELGEQHYVLLHLKEHEKAEQQTLEQVSDKVRADLLAEKSREAVEAAGKALLAALEQGQDGSEQLQQYQIQWQAPVWIKRQTNPDLAIPSLASTAFKMGTPAAEQALYQGLFVGDDYVVLALLDVKDGEVDTAQLAANNQGSILAESEFKALLASMRANTKIHNYIDTAQ